MHMRYILTIIIALGLLASCKNSGKKTDSVNLRTYETARKAQDYQTAVAALTGLVAEDSAGNAWAYDSLAFYHFFYLNIPGLVKNPSSAIYYCDEGLAHNKNNDFLLELKGKLVLSQGKDTQALDIFNALWNKTHDYTYLWEVAFVNLARGNFRFTDSIVNVVTSAQDIQGKKVRFTHAEVPMRENADVRASFLFFKALLKNNEGKFLESAEILKQCLSYEKDFYLARKGIYELQQNLSGKGMPK